MKAEPQRIIVGISGASGAIYGLRTLEQLGRLGVETHLVISQAATLTITHELGIRPADLKSRATVSYGLQDVGATISSGSFKVKGMIIAPCSVRTMSEIAYGVTSTLLTRAADVTLKERRPLVLMVRETPLHLGHLRSLVQLAEMGAVIAPPVPAMYARPSTIDDMVNHSVGRALDVFNLDSEGVKRWQGMDDSRADRKE